VKREQLDVCGCKVRHEPQLGESRPGAIRKPTVGRTNEGFNARMDSMSARLESLIEMITHKDEQIEYLVQMNARKDEQIEFLVQMNEGFNARFARLESLIENELARKAPIQQPDSPKFTPSTGSPRHGYKMKSDKKLRREQRRRNKHSKKAPPP
jgi:hypothetical protein